MNTTQHLVVRLAGAMLSVSLFAACGGGGGGGGDGGGGLSYTGLTTPAAITTGNGQEIAADALNSGDIGATTTVFASQQTVAADAGAPPRWTGMLDIFRGVASDLSHAEFSSKSSVRAITSETINEPGDCGGSVTGSITLDDTSGEVNGSVTFSGYCVEMTTMNGSVGVSGVYDEVADDFSELTLSFDRLSIATSANSYTGADNYTMDGTVAMTASSADEGDIVINVLLSDASGDVFKAENLTLHWLDDPVFDTSDVTITGRFFEPEYGYADVTTPTPLRFHGDDDWPSSGVFKVTGASGSNATLTALSNTSYRLDIDEDGDNNSDLTTTGLWDDLGADDAVMIV